MRLTVRNPLSSARPTRGALLATLFSVITGALVLAFGSVDPEPPVIETTGEIADESLEVQPEPGLAAAVRAIPGTTSGTPEDVADVAALGRPHVYSDPIGALEGVIPDEPEPEPEKLVLAAAPKASPDSTTTQLPTTSTTEAPTTTETPTTTAAPAGTEGETTESSDTSDTSETTAATTEATETTEAPVETTTTVAPAETTTTGHPDGWVDAGHGVYVPPVLLAIRFCESTDNYQAANPYSSARGAYQFLTSSWAAYGHADRYGVTRAHLASPAQQDEAALITWQRDGTRPWNASKSCWS